MSLKIFENFNDAIKWSANSLYNNGYKIHTEKWQGKEIKYKDEFAHLEIMNHSFKSKILNDIHLLEKDIKPNLPWANDHFIERVNGLPLNPGEEYINWPSYKNNKQNDKFRTEKEKFTHTYMERYWPKYAGEAWDETKDLKEADDQYGEHLGIRYSYGDLNDVINLLEKEPSTRQAILPIWFPEDTGVLHGGRVPCSISYHFIQRFGYLHCIYYIRSCDFMLHFKDDIYLTTRLVLWVLDKLKNKDKNWRKIKPGLLTMHIDSLHMFYNQKELLKKYV